MNRRLKLIFLTILSVFTIFEIKLHAETSGSFEVVLQKEKNDGNPLDPIDNEGRRSPSRPLYCTIYENGAILGMESEEIISYEIWDVNNDFCYACFAEASEFSYFLFNNPGEFKILILTDEWLYVVFLSTR